MFTLDHVVPRITGGANTVGDLVIACPRCNQAKRAMTVQEFSAWLRWRGFGRLTGCDLPDKK